MRFFSVVLFALLFVSSGQIFGQNKAVARIPFSMMGSYIIIKAQINQSSELNFIFDSGIRSTIITELQTGDSISLVFNDERFVQGLGGRNSIFAFVSDGNTINFGKRIAFENKTVALLQEDVLELSRQIGTRINGLLGADLFEEHIVHIDFIAQRLSFYPREGFSLPKRYHSLPLMLEQQKIYVPLSVKDTEGKDHQLKMLLDTGAGLCAWFRTIGSDALPIPENKIYGRIGEGISGEVTGYLARVPKLCLADFCLKNPVVVFPDSVCIADLVINTGRDGTIGNQLLSRFNLFVDVAGRQLHLRPNSNFNKKFGYNVAGLEVIQTIAGLPQYEVVEVWADSPADRAGILPGDIIREVNGDIVYSMTLSELRGYFEHGRKKALRITLERNESFITVNLELKAKI